MTAESKSTIKAYFETGDKPTQAQFENLIDSYQDYSGSLNAITTQASAGTQGFPLIQSQSSAQFYNPGSLGLALILSDTAASGRSELGLATGTTGFVKVTDNDTTDGRLNAKVSAHTGLTQTVTSPAGDEGLRIALNYATTAQAATGTEATLPIHTGLARHMLEGQYVTTAQAVTGTLGTGTMNPTLTRNLVISHAFTSANYATTAQAIAGTDATTVINPVLLKNAIGGTNALVLLSSAAASANSSIDFLSLITSTYSSYRWVISDLRPATAEVSLWMRTSTNNSTFDAAASDYSWGCQVKPFSPTTVGDDGDAADHEMVLNCTDTAARLIGNAAGEGISGTVEMRNPQGTARNKGITFINHFTNSSGTEGCVYGGGARLSTGDVDAVRFLFSSGNITSGTIRMYGIT